MGLPLYKVRGYMLGAPVLSLAEYVAFDNRRRRATIGMEAFAPADPSRWRRYPMDLRDGRPFARLPVNGVELDLLVDSAGGPRPILSKADWAKLAPAVRVRRTDTDRYPTWYGFQTVDALRVDDLRVADGQPRDATLWVRREPPAGADVSTVGLGSFPGQTVVFDFAGETLWVGGEG